MVTTNKIKNIKLSNCRSIKLKAINCLNGLIYATSSCSIKTKNNANIRPGKTKVTTGVKIGGKNDAVISIIFSYGLVKYYKISNRTLIFEI